jgi:hypothetical protein
LTRRDIDLTDEDDNLTAAYMIYAMYAQLEPTVIFVAVVLAGIVLAVLLTGALG